MIIKMKKPTLILISMLVIVSIIASCILAIGCAQVAEESVAEESVAEERPFDGTTITVMTHLDPNGDGARQKAWGEVISEFENKTGITVKCVLFPWSDLINQLILSVQTGQPTDLAFVHSLLGFGKAIEADALMPLDSFITDDYDEAEIKDSLLWDKIGVSGESKYGVPFAFMVFGLFINKEYLAESGLEAPNTWQEFIEVGKALKSAEVTPFLIGASPEQFSMHQGVGQIVEGMGGKIIDNDGMAVFDSIAGIEAYEFLKSLVFDYEIMPQVAATTKYDEVVDSFAAGRVAMIIEGSHRYTRATDTLGAENVEVVRIPGLEADKPSPANIACWTLCMPKGSQNPDAAWEFIKYFNSAEVQLKFAKLSGEIPTRASASEDPYFKSPEGEILDFWVKYIADYGSVLPGPTTIAELEEIQALSLQKVLASQDSNVKEILESAVKEYNDIVSKNQ